MKIDMAHLERGMWALASAERTAGIVDEALWHVSRGGVTAGDEAIGLLDEALVGLRGSGAADASPIGDANGAIAMLRAAASEHRAGFDSLQHTVLGSRLSWIDGLADELDEGADALQRMRTGLETGDIEALSPTHLSMLREAVMSVPTHTSGVRTTARLQLDRALAAGS